MVSHSIIIKGGSDKTATHHIEGQSKLICSTAVLTSVVVQTTTKFRETVTVAGTEYDAGHGLYGVSIKFPASSVPPNATHHSGSNDEHKFENRLDVHFDQESQTFMYKPGLILQGITFDYDYDITLYRIGQPDQLLTPDEVAKIHSITLNFSCTVAATLK